MSFKSVSVAALAAVAAASNATLPQNVTTAVVYVTSVETITDCPETVTDCPVRNHNGTAYVTHTHTVLTTYCPEDETTTAPGPSPVSSAHGSSVVVSSSSPLASHTTTSAPAPAPTDDTTTYVTVEHGVTVTVVGHKTKAHSSGVVEVPTSNSTVYEANGAASFGVAGLAAVAAGALLL